MSGLAAPGAGHDPSEPGEKREAIERLAAIRQRFSTLLATNWAPDKIDIAFDELVLPLAVAAENARTPGLNLTLLERSDELATWLADAECPAEGKRAISPIPVFDNHIVVTDVRRRNGKTSALVIEPLTPDDNRARLFDSHLLPALRTLVPPGTRLAMLALGTQKARAGCHFFALSAASKLAQEKTMLDKIHDRNLSGHPLETLLGHSAGQMAGNGRMRMFNGQAILPPSFVKHSQSGTTLQNWLDASPPAYADEEVNKKHMTLHSHYGAHATTRYPQPCLEQRLAEDAEDGQVPAEALAPMRTSKSIDKMRLVFIDRAIDYLRQAPASESRKFLERLHSTEAAGHSLRDLGLSQREWGPHPATGF